MAREIQQEQPQRGSAGSATPSRWTAAQLTCCKRAAQAPIIADSDVVPISNELGFWDAWPVQELSAEPAGFPDGRELWMALGAKRFPDPAERHHHARIHLILRDGGSWRDLGPAMPEGFSPGSREWSGSAVLQRRTVTLYFTAAGKRDEAIPGFEQRLVSAQALLEYGEVPRLTSWRDLREIVTPNPQWYAPTSTAIPTAAGLQAFRDPAYFFDLLEGREYIFFAASLPHPQAAFSGAVGAARKVISGGWELLPPVVSAEGLNNELERPHVVRHSGLYYLFWSTQTHVFNPSGPSGPTGLYGMVAESLLGEWRPLNGSGMVFSNPESAPNQAYAWLVLPDLSVTSFVDQWNSSHQLEPRFGGTFAPFLRLRLRGDRAELAE